MTTYESGNFRVIYLFLILTSHFLVQCTFESHPYVCYLWVQRAFVKGQSQWLLLQDLLLHYSWHALGR